MAMNTDDTAMMRALYVGDKPVPTRNVRQIILEVSLEETDELFKRLGVALPGKPRPVVVALLNEKNAAAEPPEDRGAITPAERSAPVNHRLSQQAAMACQDKMFWRFLGAMNDTGPMRSIEEAAMLVRFHCGVLSRREFDTDPEAGKRWQKLWSDFFIWSKRPELEDA